MTQGLRDRGSWPRSADYKAEPARAITLGALALPPGFWRTGASAAEESIWSLAATAAPAALASTINAACCCLTFELRGRRRDGAWPARRMLSLGASRAKCQAGGGPAPAKG